MKVSVIVPVFNGISYISGMLSDLHVQDFKLAEFIIIDDGSTDGTYELARDLVNKFNDNRFILIRKKNAGVSSARNFGISLAKGEYIFFADADDRVAPNILKVFVERIEDNKTDFEFFPFEKVRDNNGINKIEKKQLDYSKYASYKILGKEELLNLFFDFRIQGYPFGFISRKEFWNENSFDEKVSLGEDLLALLLIILESNKIRAHINKDKLYYYIFRNESALNSITLKKSESFRHVLDTIAININSMGQVYRFNNLYYGWYVECYKISVRHNNLKKAKYYKSLMVKFFLKTHMPILSRMRRLLMILKPIKIRSEQYDH